ncbi:MAG: hypothetical protein AAGI88_15045 [Pseudomonadota bacterium]
MACTSQTLPSDLPEWTMPALDLAANAEETTLNAMRDRPAEVVDRPERIAC